MKYEFMAYYWGKLGFLGEDNIDKLWSIKGLFPPENEFFVEKQILKFGLKLWFL